MREAEIKRALTEHLAKVADVDPSHFIEELRLNGGEIRADLVHVQDMHCYEIKSDFDTLRRLINQGSRYARVFDHITLVMAERHVAKALPLLPPWWGAMLVDSHTGTLSALREAKSHAGQRADYLTAVLTREEVLQILEESGTVKGWRSKSLYLIQQHLAQSLPLDEVKKRIRQALIARVSNKPLSH